MAQTNFNIPVGSYYHADAATGMITKVKKQDQSAADCLQNIWEIVVDEFDTPPPTQLKEARDAAIHLFNGYQKKMGVSGRFGQWINPKPEITQVYNLYAKVMKSTAHVEKPKTLLEIITSFFKNHLTIKNKQFVNQETIKEKMVKIETKNVLELPPNFQDYSSLSSEELEDLISIQKYMKKDDEEIKESLLEKSDPPDLSIEIEDEEMEPLPLPPKRTLLDKIRDLFHLNRVKVRPEDLKAMEEAEKSTDEKPTFKNELF